MGNRNNVTQAKLKRCAPKADGFDSHSQPFVISLRAMRRKKPKTVKQLDKSLNDCGLFRTGRVSVKKLDGTIRLVSSK